MCVDFTEILVMPSPRLIFRHGLVSTAFVLLYLVLNRPEVIFISRIGFVAWYPAIGLVVALLLGLSPRYALLVCFADAFAGRVIYDQAVMSFSGALGSVGSALCYASAAYLLRGPLRIDLGLRRRRDVVRYVLVDTIAAGIVSSLHDRSDNESQIRRTWSSIGSTWCSKAADRSDA